MRKFCEPAAVRAIRKNLLAQGWEALDASIFLGAQAREVEDLGADGVHRCGSGLCSHTVKLLRDVSPFRAKGWHPKEGLVEVEGKVAAVNQKDCCGNLLSVFWVYRVEI